MAQIPRSSFLGYRELEIEVAAGRVMLPLFELDGPVPHQMKVYKGDAPDSYGDMTVFPWQTEIVLLQVWSSKGVFQLSSDGAGYEDEKELDPEKNLGSWFRRYAARGFRVKSKTPGSTARYQVIIYR